MKHFGDIPDAVSDAELDADWQQITFNTLIAQFKSICWFIGHGLAPNFDLEQEQTC